MGEHTPGELVRGRSRATSEGWPEIVVVVLSMAVGVGAVFFVTFQLQAVELHVGLALALVEVVGLAAAGALDWPGPRSRIGMTSFGVGWLMWSVLSGTALAMFPLDSMSSGVLKLLTAGSLLFGPTVASALACIGADRIRLHVVRRNQLPPHAG